MRVDSTYTMIRKMMMVVTRAIRSVPMYWRKFAPSSSTATMRGMNPTGYWSLTGAQLMKPLTIAWEMPAMMKSPTPDPIPHFVTTSSMKTIRSPPMHIWTKMRNETRNAFPPKNMSAMTGSGMRNPPTRFGAASMTIIAKMRSFCRPMYWT